MRFFPLRTSAATFGIAIGVAVLAAVTIVNRSILSGVAATTVELAGKADLQITGGASGLQDSLLEKVRDVPGVTVATPITEQVASAFGPGGQRERVLLMGIDFLGTDASFFQAYASSDIAAIRKDVLDFANGTHHIILNRDFAQRLGLRVRDKLRIAVSTGVEEFEVWGFIDLEGVASAYGGSLGLMYYPAMQAVFNRGTHVDRIDIAVGSDVSVDQVAVALRERLGPGFTVQQPARRSDRLAKMLQAVRVSLLMVSLSALLAGAFMVFNASAMGVIQRRKELGVMRALGATRQQLVRLLTLEAVIGGVVASALGIALSLVIAGLMLRWTSDVVSTLYVQQGVTELHADPLELFICFVLGTVCTAIAARIATQRVSHVQPVEALAATPQNVRVESRSGLVRPELVGIGLLVVTAPLVALPAVDHIPYGPLCAMVTSLLGVQIFVPRLLLLTRRFLSGPARGRWGASTALALDGIYRNVSRSAATAAGVVAAVALIISIASFLSSFVDSVSTWLSRTLPGDLLVTSGASIGALSSRNTPLAASVGDELLAIPGVAQVRPFRTVDLEFRGRTVKLLSTDVSLDEHAVQAGLVGEPARDFIAQLTRGGVAVSENFARTFDVQPGDELSLRTQDGPASFRVAAVIVNYTSDLGTILVDRKAYIEHWGDSRVDTFEIYLAESARVQELRAEITRRLGDRYDLFVLTNREFRDEIVSAVSGVFKLLRVLVIVTSLMAMLGLSATALANVLYRIREFGVLRAIGMLRGQLSRMVIIETVFIASAATLIGVVLGCGTAYILLDRVISVELGWRFPFRLPLPVLALVLLLLPLTAAIAAYLPARRAAGQKTYEALSYE